MTGAGSMRERVLFQQRRKTDDGHGSMIGDFVTVFGPVAAQITPRLGGETVMASRLQGVQPVTVTVRGSSDTRMVDTSWRCKNARTGVVYDIRAISNPDQRGDFLDMLAEAKNDLGG